MRFILFAVMYFTVQGLALLEDKKGGAKVMKAEPSKTNEVKSAELVPAEYKQDGENQKPSDKDGKVTSEKEGKMVKVVPNDQVRRIIFQSPSAEQIKEIPKQNTAEPKSIEKSKKSTTEGKERTTDKSTTVENVIKETQHQRPTRLRLFISQKKQGMTKQEEISNSESKSGDSQKNYEKTKRDLNTPCC